MLPLACAVIGVAGALCALVATPLIVRLSRKIGLMDRPGVRKVHSSAVPRTGGIAIVLSLLVVFSAALASDDRLLRSFFHPPMDVLVVLLAAIGMSMVGLADDVVGLRARYKLLAQLLIALGACAAGIRLETVVLGDSFRLELGWLSWPVTMVWIVGVTNAVNLIDGLDGLAAGISFIACAVVLTLGMAAGQPVMAMLSLVLLGCLSGFLFFNVHPAKVFLGDAGSLFLGSFLSMSCVFFANATGSLKGLLVPAMALALPICDTVFAICRRLLERRPIFAPDRNHLHHRLLDKGYPHRKVVMMMHSVTLASAVMGLVLLHVSGWAAAGVVALAALPLAIIYRVSGASFRGLVAEIKRSWRFNRAAKKDVESFLKLQLRLREAKQPGEWWLVVRRAARFLGFSKATICIEQPNRQPEVLRWWNPRHAGNGNHNMEASLYAHPFGAEQLLYVTLEIGVDEGLEVAGRRLSLFGRLLDGHLVSTRPPVAMELGRKPRPVQTGATRALGASD